MNASVTINFSPNLAESGQSPPVVRLLRGFAVKDAATSKV
jgi:hypothetical protein